MLTICVAAATSFVVAAVARDAPGGVSGDSAEPELNGSVARSLADQADRADGTGRRIAELERRLVSAERQLAARRAGQPVVSPATPAPSAASGSSGVGGPTTVGAGNVFISADAVDRLLRRPRASVVSTPDAPRRSIGQISVDLGLTDTQREAVAKLVRAHEEETARLVLGEGSIEQLRALVVEGQADAAKMSALEQRMSDNSLTNFGRLVHATDALREKLEPALGKDLAAKFVAAKREPVIDAIVAAIVDIE
ncbi:MAG: hypothetical protein K8T90_04865 [Planctomycetes bacterium]|nr:hypothetical protein [Planctomycetota bacterium]